MPEPTFTPPPINPSRSDPPATFVTRADAFVAWFSTLYAELVIMVAWVTARVAEISGAVTDGIADLNAIVTAADIAFDQKLANAGFTGESVTSNTVGTGSKTWTLEAGLSLVPGAFISAADTAAPNTNYMTGQVTSYNDATGVMVALMDKAFGSGTKTSWVFSLLGRPGSAAAIADVSGLQAALDAKAALRDTISAKTASYSAVDADNGTIIEFDSATPVTLTIAAARGAGFNVQVRQLGAGAVTIAAGSGATRRNRQSYTKTAGQYAQAVAQIAANGTDLFIDGDLAA